MLPVIGQSAPPFSLRDQHGQTVELKAFRGRSAVALVFFPLAFSLTCTGELGELRDNRALFRRAGVELLAISVDSTATLREFGERESYDFPLLADFWPHGEVAQRYGAFLPDRGHASRSTVMLDEAGIVRAAFASEPGEARPFEAYRDALTRL